MVIFAVLGLICALSSIFGAVLDVFWKCSVGLRLPSVGTFMASICMHFLFLLFGSVSDRAGVFDVA